MSKFSRIVIAYFVAVPMALALVFMIVSQDTVAVAVLGFALLFLSLPLIIQWHHLLLIFFWNSAFALDFLPGQLPMWVVLAGVTFAMAVIHRMIGHRNFLRAPELTKPILFLAAVVLVTAKLRGGLGLRILGSSSYGGRDYFMIGAAIVGYYALISQPIAVLKGAQRVNWFFLAGLTNGIGNVLYALGPASWFLFFIVPANGLGGQIHYTWTETNVTRLEGFGPAGACLLCFVLARWGIGSLFDFRKPWRILLAGAAMLLAVVSGFRSQFAFLIAFFAIQFVLEGCWKTALLPLVVLLGALCAVPLVFFANKLPGSVQRSLAFLPLNIDPEIRADTRASSEWRFAMWADVWTELPKYLLVGKGYALDPDELYLTLQGSTLERTPYEWAIVTGNYHNGPLSVLMPLGLFGFAAFVWLLSAGVKVLSWNYRYGDARLKRVNRALLAYFLAQVLFFFFVFGAFTIQLSMFLGVLGLSVSLNRGVCRSEASNPVLASAPSGALPEPA